MTRDALGELIDLAAAKADQESAAKLAVSLARTAEGGVVPSLSNVLIILAHDRHLAGLVRWNAFTYRPLITRPPPPATEGAEPLPGPYPRVWDGPDVAMITAYVQRVHAGRVGIATVEAAMHAEARRSHTHPVREYFATLQWDGHHRLDHWLHHVCGTPDDAYHQAVGSKMFIAAVRRIRYPGTKFDYIIVFEGLQGIGKSRMLRKIAIQEAWFSDSMAANLESKDAAMALAGRLIIEFAELQHVVRHEIETIKGFLSRSVDSYRPPYERNVIDVPRQGIICGTTNETDYLRDTSGNRRFWPVRVTKIDDAWLDANLTQLWAEAIAREDADEPLYLADAAEEATATREQSERLEQDVWTEAVVRYVRGHDAVTIADILQNGLLVVQERQTRREQMRVAAILRSLGWVVRVIRGHNGIQHALRVYQRR